LGERIQCRTDENSIVARAEIVGFSARAFIIHQPNAPSGGKWSHIELTDFLRRGDGPEQQALLRLIGTLVDVPPFA
jgi:hypothetical protein